MLRLFVWFSLVKNSGPISEKSLFGLYGICPVLNSFSCYFYTPRMWNWTIYHGIGAPCAFCSNWHWPDVSDESRLCVHHSSTTSGFYRSRRRDKFMEMRKCAVSHPDSSGKKDEVLEGCIAIGYIMPSLLIMLFSNYVASHIFFTLCKWSTILPCAGELTSVW